MGSILAEIGINLGGMIPEAASGAPMTNAAVESAAPSKAMEAPIGHSGNGGGGDSGPAGGNDTGLSELEARLNNLRRDNN